MTTIAPWPVKTLLPKARVQARWSDTVVPINIHYDSYPCIVRTPGTCGGEPRIDGTRISVRIVADLYWQNESVKNLAEMYQLDEWKIEQAIDYARTHKEEVEALILRNERA